MWGIYCSTERDQGSGVVVLYMVLYVYSVVHGYKKDNYTAAVRPILFTTAVRPIFFTTYSCETDSFYYSCETDSFYYIQL